MDDDLVLLDVAARKTLEPWTELSRPGGAAAAKRFLRCEPLRSDDVERSEPFEPVMFCVPWPPPKRWLPRRAKDPPPPPRAPRRSEWDRLPVFFWPVTAMRAKSLRRAVW